MPPGRRRVEVVDGYLAGGAGAYQLAVVERVGGLGKDGHPEGVAHRLAAVGDGGLVGGGEGRRHGDGGAAALYRLVFAVGGEQRVADSILAREEQLARARGVGGEGERVTRADGVAGGAEPDDRLGVYQNAQPDAVGTVADGAGHCGKAVVGLHVLQRIWIARTCLCAARGAVLIPCHAGVGRCGGEGEDGVVAAAHDVFGGGCGDGGIRLHGELARVGDTCRWLGADAVAHLVGVGAAVGGLEAGQAECGGAVIGGQFFPVLVPSDVGAGILGAVAREGERNAGAAALAEPRRRRRSSRR